MKGEGRYERSGRLSSWYSRRLTRGAGPWSVVGWKELDLRDLRDHGNREDWTLGQPLMGGGLLLGVLDLAVGVCKLMLKIGSGRLD